MIKKIYSLYDAAAAFHDLPYFAMSDEDAVRMVALSMRSPQSKIAMSPEDFSVWYHGEFEQREGTFFIHEAEKRRIQECRFLNTVREGAGEHLQPHIEQARADGLNGEGKHGSE